MQLVDTSSNRSRYLSDNIEFLIKEGHDVIPVKRLGLERASDLVLLQKAKEMERIFLTRDKDFGTLVFLERESSGGVILLRGRPFTSFSLLKTR